MIGGNGERRTLPLVAKYANEWNAVFVTAERFRELNGRLDELAVAEGREPGAVRRTLMTRLVLGRDEAEIRRRLGERDAAEMRGRGAIVGGPVEIVETLGQLGDAGVERVMGQWLELDDVAGLETVAAEVLTQL